MMKLDHGVKYDYLSFAKSTNIYVGTEVYVGVILVCPQ